MGPPVFKLVARNSRKNSPFFKNDSNAPQSPLRGTPKQEPRDREGERTYQRLNKNKKQTHHTGKRSFNCLLILPGPAVQKVDSAMQLVSLILIHWRVIYPVDSAITLLNNWGQPVPKSQQEKERARKNRPHLFFFFAFAFLFARSHLLRATKRKGIYSPILIKLQIIIISEIDKD